MTLDAITHAEDFVSKWEAESPPYELPNGEVINTERETPLCFTIKGQECSLDADIKNVVTLVRKPTQEVFAGYDLFFIFEKIGVLRWQFRTVDIDGAEEIHYRGRYTQTKQNAQEYLDKYRKLTKIKQTIPESA